MNRLAVAVGSTLEPTSDRWYVWMFDENDGPILVAEFRDKQSSDAAAFEFASACGQTDTAAMDAAVATRHFEPGPLRPKLEAVIGALALRAIRESSPQQAPGQLVVQVHSYPPTDTVYVVRFDRTE